MSGESAALFLTQNEWRANLKMDKKEGLTIVVLEGKTDWYFWSKMMDSRKSYITAFKPRQYQMNKNKKKEKMNKAKVIETIYELRHPVEPWRPSRENGIMGLIDSDYWESPFHLDRHLDEQLLSVIKDFLVEEGKNKEIDRKLENQISEIRDDILTTSPNTDRDNIEFHLNDIVALIGSVSQEDLDCSILMAKEIGILRALNDERQLYLSFQQLKKVQGFANFIDNKEIDITKLLKTVLDDTPPRYKKPRFDKLKHEYESAKRRYEKLGLTSVELANGHDIEFCLRYLLDIHPNQKISPKITFDSIRDITLVKKIRDWEEKNKPYCVLPQ